MVALHAYHRVETFHIAVLAFLDEGMVALDGIVVVVAFQEGTAYLEEA